MDWEDENESAVDWLGTPVPHPREKRKKKKNIGWTEVERMELQSAKVPNGQDDG